MSEDRLRLHPDDIAAIADEVIRRMRAPRPRAKRDERPTVTPEQQQHARDLDERIAYLTDAQIASVPTC